MSIRQALVDDLWRGVDPFADLAIEGRAVDFQGWNSQHPYLVKVVAELRPARIVEIGVWKGASVLTMAKAMKSLSVDGAVIAVDTWLGSWDHWLVAEYLPELQFKNGYPQLSYKFAANMVLAGVGDFVVPLPLDSLNALEVFRRKGMTIDAVHIDAGHDYLAVSKDIEGWWGQIRPGGVLIADDYFDDENKAWPEVKQAVDDFVSANGLDLQHENGKAWITKP